jgi:hypothetical protein
VPTAPHRATSRSLIYDRSLPAFSLLSRGAVRQLYSSGTALATPIGSHSLRRYLRFSLHIHLIHSAIVAPQSPGCSTAVKGTVGCRDTTTLIKHP